MGVVWKMQPERERASTQKIRSMCIHSYARHSPLISCTESTRKRARKDSGRQRLRRRRRWRFESCVRKGAAHNVCNDRDCTWTHGNGCTCERKHATSLGYPFERMHHVLSVHVWRVRIQFLHLLWWRCNLFIHNIMLILYMNSNSIQFRKSVV